MPLQSLKKTDCKLHKSRAITFNLFSQKLLLPDMPHPSTKFEENWLIKCSKQRAKQSTDRHTLNPTFLAEYIL